MNFLTYRITLYKLSRERDKEYTRLYKLVEEAEKKGGREAGQLEYASENFDAKSLDDEIAYLKGQFLISKAERMSLPIPPVTDKYDVWGLSYHTNKWLLTNKGVMELRQIIRKEQKARLEIASHWAGIIIGIIGAITGLIAVITK